MKKDKEKGVGRGFVFPTCQPFLFLRQNTKFSSVFVELRAIQWFSTGGFYNKEMDVNLNIASKYLKQIYNTTWPGTGAHSYLM